MATLTPGELLWVNKENNAQLLTPIPAIFSANSSPRTDGRSDKPQRVYRRPRHYDAWVKMTAKNRPGRTYFPPRDVKHAGTAVVFRWWVRGGSTAGQPPLSAIKESSRLTSPTPPFRRQQHQEETEETASYIACKEK